jgi:hypothetical protein
MIVGESPDNRIVQESDVRLVSPQVSITLPESVSSFVPPERILILSQVQRMASVVIWHRPTQFAHEMAGDASGFASSTVALSVIWSDAILTSP